VLTALTAGLALALLVVWVKSHFFAPPEDADFYIYNGLGQTVTVGFPGGGAVLAPGDRHTQRLRLGEKFEITTRINGHDAEKLSVQAPQSPETSLIYSAAGAVPFVEWVARYGPESGSGTGERALGAPTLFYTDARAVLTMPPETVRSKSGSESILTLTPVRMHPELMLRDLPKGERDQIVEAQARWNDPSEQYLPLWLNYLTLTAQERALEILEDRLADYPGDVFAIRALMDSCPRERRAELCEGVAADAESRPSDPSLAYLSVRCLEPKEARGEKYLALAEKFPGDAFASRAAGFALFFRGDFEGAHALLKRAFHQEPRVMLADMDFLARLMRHQGENTAVISSEIGPWSPHIRQLLSIGEAGGGEFSESTGEAFRLLAEGRPAEACGAAAPPLSQYMLYLCAASDGAPRELVERALDAPPLEHLATGNAWPAMGLFLREKRDPAAIEGYILDNASDLTEAVSAIHLAKEMDPEQLDHFMLGLDPWLQGSLSLVLRIALGEECPERFSEAAKGFLFAAERPYLR
jgi:tetratricopeptide (TPR) repeat protein